MDEIDRRILNLIQNEFPLESRPFLELAKKLSLSEEETLERVQRMKEEGVIRRIGAILDSNAIGFFSTLCAAKVPQEKIQAFVEVVNSYAGVTHNYLRNHDYNVWFTFTGKSMEAIEQALEEISHKTGVDEIKNLPRKRCFKVKVNFKL